MLVLNGRCNTSLVPHRKMTKDWQLNVLSSNTPITTTKWISKGGQKSFIETGSPGRLSEMVCVNGLFPEVVMWPSSVNTLTEFDIIICPPRWP